MPKPNALASALAENKRLRERVQYLEAMCRVTQQWTGQLCDDLITVVLADAAVMGKDTFGPARIAKINARRNELWGIYVDALRAHPEADYLRADIDRRLRQIMPEQAVPWAERYFGWTEGDIDKGTAPCE